MNARGVLLLLAALGSTGAEAVCPCYTASSSSNTYNCGTEAQPGTNPTVAEWQAIFALVAQGPSVWTNQGPSIADIGQGCGKPQVRITIPARFPCEILKAIAMAESTWRQFCVPDRPADQVGGLERTIISFDCGYGVGQVTSGMHTGDNPAFVPFRVAAEPVYNLAAGAQILADKWRVTQCVGDNQPSLIENWYSAIWAYNGLSYTNNPNNPSFSSNRGVWNPSVGGAAPYQEKVLGYMEYPPGTQYWSSTAPAYPDLVDVGGASSPPALPEPSCGSPTDCSSTRPIHLSSCFGGATDGGVISPDAGPSIDAGVDAGVTDAGSDAGQPDGSVPLPDGGVLLPDGGVAPPLALTRAGSRLGYAPPGCGGACTGEATLAAAGIVLALRRRRSSR